jgi:hypothetical protein
MNPDRPIESQWRGLDPVWAMLRRQRSCTKKHLRQIRLNVVPKLPLMKLRYYNVSEERRIEPT